MVYCCMRLETAYKEWIMSENRTNAPSTMPLNDTQKPRKAAPKPESKKHLRPLSNGAIYDMEKKRIVANPGGGTTAITKENATVLQARGVELKRQAMIRAANKVAEQGGGVDGRELVGDLAFVEAIGEAMTMKALSVNDPKAVDAARFVFTEAGIGEKQVEQEQRGPLDPVGHALNALVQYLVHGPAQQPEIIEGDVTTIRSDLEADSE